MKAGRVDAGAAAERAAGRGVSARGATPGGRSAVVVAPPRGIARHGCVAPVHGRGFIGAAQAEPGRFEVLGVGRGVVHGRVGSRHAARGEADGVGGRRLTRAAATHNAHRIAGAGREAGEGDGRSRNRLGGGGAAGWRHGHGIAAGAGHRRKADRGSRAGNAGHGQAAHGRAGCRGANGHGEVLGLAAAEAVARIGCAVGVALGPAAYAHAGGALHRRGRYQQAHGSRRARGRNRGYLRPLVGIEGEVVVVVNPDRHDAGPAHGHAQRVGHAAREGRRVGARGGVAGVGLAAGSGAGEAGGVERGARQTHVRDVVAATKAAQARVAIGRLGLAGAAAQQQARQ